MANSYKEDRSEVIAGVLLGIIIISATIINYIFYIKRNLRDFDPVIREATKKSIIKIGEVLELIFFVIFALMPIWRIPKFIEVFANRKELIFEIVRAFALSVASIVLLFSLNPIDFKTKLKINKNERNNIDNIEKDNKKDHEKDLEKCEDEKKEIK